MREHLVLTSLLVLVALSRARTWRRSNLFFGAAKRDAGPAPRPALPTGLGQARRPAVTASLTRKPAAVLAPPARSMAAVSGALRARRPIATGAFRRDVVLLGTIAVVALLVVLAVPHIPGLLQLTQLREPASRPAGSATGPSSASLTPAPEPSREVRQAASAKLQDEPASPLRGALQLEPYRIAWPYDIADGLTFGPEGALKTRLAGLEGPARDAVCNDRNGQPWACGLQARAALNNVTRRQNLLCDPIAEPTGSTVPARCRGDLDLARELVLSGFARPTGRDPQLEAAAQEAQAAERGLWNGGWTIRITVR